MRLTGGGARDWPVRYDDINLCRVKGDAMKCEHIQVVEREDVHDLMLVGSTIDRAKLDEIRRAMENYIDDHSPMQLLLSFGQHKELSSAVLGVVVSLNKRVRSYGGQMRLVCTEPRTFELFRVMKLDRILDIYQHHEDALATMGKVKVKARRE